LKNASYLEKCGTLGKMRTLEKCGILGKMGTVKKKSGTLG